MESLEFKYNATKRLARKVHVGVVGSGDLEIIMVPVDTDHTKVSVRTGSDGFFETWEAVLTRFFSINDVKAQVVINDFGATPGVVSLRLAQALEVSEYHENN